jgi:hypothetical protein
MDSTLAMDSMIGKDSKQELELKLKKSEWTQYWNLN